MSIFGFQFRPRKPQTVQAAKKRLQILPAHERADISAQDVLSLLQHDILEVIRRHPQIDGDAVDIRMGRDAAMAAREACAFVGDPIPGIGS